MIVIQIREIPDLQIFRWKYLNPAFRLHHLTLIPAMNKNALYDITYGLYVVGCFSDDERASGCIINTCFQVTSENPSLAICLNKNNYTLECIKKNPRFCLSIISEATNPMIISSFGFRSSRDADKYADFGYDELNGTPAVKGQFCGRLMSLLWLVLWSRTQVAAHR